MLIIWGSRLYGKCDEVPGLCHVATHFGHLWYIPLIPLGSHVIVAEEGDGWRGAKAPLSFKSILVAWLRAAMIVGMIVAGIACIPVFADGDSTFGFGLLGVAVACMVLLVASYRLGFIRRASYERAHRLGECLGLNERGRILIDLAYGVISEREAECALEALEEIESRRASEA